MRLKKTKICSKLSNFIHASVLTTGLALSGCSEQKLTETFLQPYKGEIGKDKNGEYFQLNTILLTVTDGTTKDDVERLISSYAGEITGWLKIENTFIIFLPKDQRDRALKELSKNPEVISADRNYYYRNFSDNDQLAADSSKYSCADWYKTISLSAGLDLVQNKTLYPVVIAVIEVDRFDIKNSQIPYVDEKYHADYSQSPNIIYSADIGDFGRIYSASEHSSDAATVAAGRNDGYLTNGVAALPNIQILPLATGNLEIHPEYVKMPLDLLNNFISTRAHGANITKALEYVISKSDELPIRVVNLSLGGSEKFPESVHKALAKLNQKGIIVVAGAGNSNQDIKDIYPASFEGVIAVGATEFNINKNKEGRWFSHDAYNEASNFSTELNHISIAAPGGVLVPYKGDALSKTIGFFIGGQKYSCFTATSAATPQVSGLVALMKSIKPDLTYKEVVKLLRDNADPIVLDDDPESTIKGQTWYRINIRNTLAALTQADLNTCKQLDRFEELGVKDRLSLMDSYGPNILLHQLNSGSTQPLVYDFDNNIYFAIPWDKNKYASYGDLSIWKNEIIFRCGLKVCRFVLGNTQIEEMNEVSATKRYDINYWAGTATYLNGPQKVVSHNYTEKAPASTTIPNLTRFGYYENYIRSVFSPTTVILQVDTPTDHLFLYDSNGLAQIPFNYKMYKYSNPYDNSFVFTEEKDPNKVYLLDLKTKTINPLTIPSSSISLATNYWQDVFIEYFEGKLVTTSAHDPQTIYVWDVQTAKKIFQFTLPDGSYFNNLGGVVLKGGILTIHVGGHFQVGPTTFSGTRTYSCPIK